MADESHTFDVRQVQKMILGLLRDALPKAVSDETVAGAFRQAQEQELKIGQVYVDLLEPEKRLEYPYWGIELIAPDGSSQVYMVPKALDAITNPADLLIWVAIFAFMVAPAVRALVMALGYKFQFKYAKKIAARSDSSKFIH